MTVQCDKTQKQQQEMRQSPQLAWPLFFLCLLLLSVSQVRAQADGKALFAAKCAVCHGQNGDANSIVGKGMKLRDLRSSDVQKQTDNRLSTIVRCGKGKMPGYESRFSDAQISQLVAYMRILAGHNPR